ncbi:MAG: UvrD-helicase domain-containing protein, partial [Aeromonas sp.]
MAPPLDTLRFPLYGERLIEASAGTGKTYTIAGLYLRLLLGHGPCIETGEEAGLPSAHARPLGVTDILVVTFTEAATAELRGRIRARIHQARLAFLQGESGDELLSCLLSEVGDHVWAAQQLLNAERQMDEAAIFTIHGFCQRMLAQNAFESGALFESEFIKDESALMQLAVSDYWRREFYPLALADAQVVRQIWPTPQALLRDVQPLLSAQTRCWEPEQVDEPLRVRLAANRARSQQIKAAWAAQLDAICQQVEGHVSRYTGKLLQGWLEKIAVWVQSESIDAPKELARFAQSTLEEKLSKTGTCPSLPLFSEIEAYCAAPPSFAPLVLMRAAREIKVRLSASKQQTQLRSFDDLLLNLDNALQSRHGEALRARIRAQFAVAMIDEFQDTDPQQYRIFKHIYGQRADEEAQASALLMIGDPKQAIYGFRGADIFTYIHARRQVRAHYSLGKNWRSSQALVAAVNGLFLAAKAPFIYDADIPFLPVAAAGKSAALTVAGVEAPVLTCWQLAGVPTVSKGDYQSKQARACAIEIHRLLSLAQDGQAHIGQAAVKAGDIAVLVRTGAEGKRVQRELA